MKASRIEATEPLSYEAVIEKIPHDGGWHIVRIPDTVIAELRSLAGKKGNIPVDAQIGKTTWKSTIMSMGEQQWFVAVKADVRKAENLHEGDDVTVNLAPDFSRIT